MKRAISYTLNVIFLLCIGVIVTHEGYVQKIKRKLCKPPVQIAFQGESQCSSSLDVFHSTVQNDKKVLICAFGDSVTQGCTEAGVIDCTCVFHHQLKNLLEDNYPNVVFNVINSGKGGDTAFDGLGRIEQDVLLYKPQLVLVEFGLNDCAAEGLWGVEDFKSNLQQIIDSIKAQSGSDIILMTPNFMATSDNLHVCEEHRKLAYPDALSELQNNRTLFAYTNAICEIGKLNEIPVANIYDQWEYLLTTGVDTNDLLANGLNHPNAMGHLITAKTLFEIINPDYTFDIESIADSRND